jgi:hypothetical protein
VTSPGVAPHSLTRHVPQAQTGPSWPCDFTLPEHAARRSLRDFPLSNATRVVASLQIVAYIAGGRGCVQRCNDCRSFRTRRSAAPLRAPGGPFSGRSASLLAAGAARLNQSRDRFETRFGRADGRQAFRLQRCVGTPHADHLGVRAEVDSTEAPARFARCVVPSDWVCRRPLALLNPPSVLPARRPDCQGCTSWRLRQPLRRFQGGFQAEACPTPAPVAWVNAGTTRP